MKYRVLLIAGAVAPYLLDHTLSWRVGLALLLVLAIVYLITRLLTSLSFYSAVLVRRACACLAVFIAMFSITTFHLQQRLDHRLPPAMDKLDSQLTGVVRGLPETGSDHLRFLFMVDNEAADAKHTLDNRSEPAQSALAGRLIRVHWHQRQASAGGLPVLHPGERWRLPLQLRTTRAQVNFVGTDPERWSFADGIAARGFVVAGAKQLKEPISRFNPDRWREAVLTKMQRVGGDSPAFPMLAALAIADRRQMTAADRQVLAATGTGHLLAISGLHIGLAAVIGYFVGRVLLMLLVSGLRLQLAMSLPWMCAWLAAFSYAVLAGFGVSTQRALIMLSVATLVVLSRRKVHPASAWLVAMVLVLFIDPFAPLRAGFWFSFLAVAVLLFLFSPRFGHIPAWRKMLFAQIGISLVMAPLGMYFFQQSSLPGLLANLVAIPLVSFVSVPLILFGMLLMWLPGALGSWIFEVAGLSLHYLLIFLQQLATWQPDFMVSSSPPMLFAMILAMLGALLIIMPQGFPGRAFGLLLLLPVFLPAGSPVARGTIEVDMLDVGQGLAMLVGSHDYLMVYDTGPGDGQKVGAGKKAGVELTKVGGWDTVNGSIQPAIARRAIPPDLIVASHADLDHAGGLNSLREIWPSASVLASFPQTQADLQSGVRSNVQRGVWSDVHSSVQSDVHSGVQSGVHPCNAGQSWKSVGLSFQVLHPALGLPYLGNDSSCVISVIGLGLSVLLTGDISKAVERRLVEQGLTTHQLISVPHHGSASSSSERFIDAVRPALALNSAAANNRFDFPRQEVVARFDQAGTLLLNTAVCGGLRITSAADGGFTLQSARLERDAIWRFKADDNCP